MNKEGKSGTKRKYNILRIISLLFLIIFVISTMMFAYSIVNEHKEKSALIELAKSKLETEKNVEKLGSSIYGANGMLKKYELLNEENPDFKGWIKIEDTNIDYPVMLNLEDTQYYLRRNFQEQNSISGLPFIGGKMDLSENNLVIYGHNMNNRTMFADLLLYKDEKFWEGHPYIQFDTLYKEEKYQIVGAFYSKAYYTDETDVFRYYDYEGQLTPEEYAQYIEQVKANSLYDTKINSEYGDKLITLSTCSYHTKNGRFVVVAKKV